jgi:23S rRNA U2552 (ribose-2'-O)-methylase RlmE/FtsJ
MNTETNKPPWTRFQWYGTPPRFFTNLSDLSGCPIEGEWIEEENQEIMQLKESIQPYDRTELWDLAKRITNPYELISTHSNRLKLPKSTSCINPLSRSFFKMIEMLTRMEFFERHKNPKMKSLHICEGPGGFIEAFYYMCRDKNRIIQSTHAMTLKSTHTIIPGWRRATQFLQKHPQIQLLYGPTKTGNIYEPCNQDECVTAAGPGGAHLVTSDGGFDFSDDFHAQEKTILRLLVSSSLILLRAVAVEGDIVLKMFDCNSSATRDLITILASCFHNWTLYKPVTSRPCNSEWYFIGKSALRNRAHAIQILTHVRDGLAMEPPVSYSRFLVTNPLEDFLKDIQIKRCDVQMKALKEVLSFCKNKDSINYESLWEKQRKPSILWCNEFHIPTEFRGGY